MDERFVNQLEKFKDEFTFAADDIQLLFAQLTRRIDSIIGQEFSELRSRAQNSDSVCTYPNET